MKKILFALFFIPCTVFAQTLCENGYAGIYPCENVDLLCHLPPDSIGGASTNEVWGWTDTTDGIEYVLLGMSTGVGFFDISNPVQPVYLGILPTHTNNSTWRTLRTYGNYLFVGSEANSHGLQVFDLTQLQSVANPPQTFFESAYYNGFGKCHTLVIDEAAGYLYACGTNTYGGGLHIVNIQNPLAPAVAGGYDLNGYVHEAQVLQYNGPDEDYVGETIVIAFNGNSAEPLTIVNTTDPSDATTVSTTSYTGQDYCHQGWLTPDGGYLLLNDEFDENFGPYDNTRTVIFDMHDLDNPIYMGDYNGPTAAVDHNEYIIGNLVYQSNYTAGFYLLDATNIADTTLQQVGYFDHYPSSNAAAYDGEWMNYPFFESGVVALTDIYNGMFLVQPNLIEVMTDDIACGSGNITLQVVLKQGFKGPYDIAINGLPPDASYTYDASQASAPDTIEVTIESMSYYESDLNITVDVQGQYNNYQRSVNIPFLPLLGWYLDEDGDGYGISTDTTASCTQPTGYAPLQGDCNDEDASIYPSAPGTGDGVDNNCNNIMDPTEDYFCADLDGDDVITVSDLIIMNGEIGCSGANCIGDLNEDELVNITDFIILLSDFGELCND